MDKKHLSFMRIALKEAFWGCSRGEGGPFGSCVVLKGKVVGRGHNRVLKTNDPARHAEIEAISQAAKRLKRWDLGDCVIYATTEPCPMCFSAIHWARIRKVFYGTGIGDVKKLGFNELTIPSRTMKKLGKSPVKLWKGVGRAECLKVLRHWSKLPDKKTY